MNKTPEGKQSWQAALCATISEGIGLLVTCWCSCTICCHLGCAYCLVLCGGGIANGMVVRFVRQSSGSCAGAAAMPADVHGGVVVGSGHIISDTR